MAARCDLISAEYFINTDPGQGNATALEAKDGTYDSIHESVSLAGIEVSGLGVGDHHVGIRFKASAGNWSLVEYRGFRVMSDEVDLEPEVVATGGGKSGKQMVAAEIEIETPPEEAPVGESQSNGDV